MYIVGEAWKLAMQLDVENICSQRILLVSTFSFIIFLRTFSNIILFFFRRPSKKQVVKLLERFNYASYILSTYKCV